MPRGTLPRYPYGLNTNNRCRTHALTRDEQRGLEAGGLVSRPELAGLVGAQANTDGLNPIERNGCNDIFEIRAQYPDKLLFGNVCCVHTLPHGTLGDVEDETLELIEKIGPKGGVFIGSSSEVHDAVPVANAAKMYRTVHAFGTYPIDVDRIRARRMELRQQGALKLRADMAM